MATEKKSTRKRKRRKPEWLVFIDTNVLLDFYRQHGARDELSILEHVDEHPEKIITTMQVEMEFMSNRHRVITDAHNAIGTLKLPQTPAFLTESEPAQAIEKNVAEIETRIGRIRDRTTRLLKDPAQHDPVYQTLRRLWHPRGDGDPCPYHMTRETRERQRIRALAQKRFKMGYPPRKPNDTSMGDAINWEWMIHCAAKLTNANVIIVSRDSDYGRDYKGEVYLNDWLREEFKDRVTRQRDVRLTNRLTVAFDLAGIRTTKKERDQEDEVIEQSARVQAPPGFNIDLVPDGPDGGVPLAQILRTMRNAVTHVRPEGDELSILDILRLLANLNDGPASDDDED